MIQSFDMNEIYDTKFRDLYKNLLLQKQAKDDNDKIICLLEAGTLVQKMENAKQVRT